MTIEMGVVISACALAIAFAGWLSGTKKDAGKQEAHRATVETKLDNIGEDVKDIKADNRSIRNELMEVRQIAVHASERAEAAHKRLDRSGIDAHD